MTSQPRKQAITLYIYITQYLKRKGNQIMKSAQLIEYSMRNVS